MENPVTIAIVLDPLFGEQIARLVAEGPVWATGSIANREAVEKCWKASPENDVTYWTEPRSGKSEEEWLDILDDIELHHSEDWAGPGIAAIRVFGASATPAAQSALREFGYEVTETTPDGFRARKIAAPE